jgi:hypothetical protein
LVRLKPKGNQRELAADQRHDLPEVVAPERRRLLERRGVRDDAHRRTLREPHRVGVSQLTANDRDVPYR